MSNARQRRGSRGRPDRVEPAEPITEPAEPTEPSLATVQIQAHLSRLGYSPGPLDGAWGPKTTRAIYAAGLAHLGSDDDSAARTLSALIQAERSQIPVLTLSEMVAYAPSFRASWLAPLNAAIVTAHITEARFPFWIAQLAHESNRFRSSAEIGGDIRPYAPFYGRGPIQLTHRSNYKQAGAFLGLPLAEEPELVLNPWIGWQCAAWFWLQNNLNRFSPADGQLGDFLGLTRAINGGTNGLADREEWLDRANSLFRLGAGLTESPAPPRATATEEPAPAVLIPPEPLPSPPEAHPPPSATLPPESSMPLDLSKKRKRAIRKMFRLKKDFWVGQYQSYLDSGMDSEEAFEEVRADFQDWALSSLAMQLDKRARWKFIRNEEVRAAFEKYDGGAFMAILKGALRVISAVRSPVAGLLSDRAHKAEHDGMANFFDAFSELMNAALDEPEIIEEPSERSTEIRREPMVINANPTLVVDDIPIVDDIPVVSEAANLPRSRTAPPGWPSIAGPGGE